ACVRPAASVHPEPGSNSSSLIFKRSRANMLNNQQEFQYSKQSILSVDLRRFQLDLTLSIQYVYELLFIFSQLVSLLSGCKFKTLFFIPQMFFGFFSKSFFSLSKPPKTHPFAEL